jgi:hypothetical protein
VLNTLLESILSLQRFVRWLSINTPPLPTHSVTQQAMAQCTIHDGCSHFWERKIHPRSWESPKELFGGAASAHHKDKLNLLCAALQPVDHTYRHRRYRHRCSDPRPSSISTPPGEAFLTKKGATCAVIRQKVTRVVHAFRSDAVDGTSKSY